MIMRKIFIFTSILCLLFPKIAYANGAGLPTFFKINGQFTQPNPLQLYGITSQSFLLPQDITTENYIVNQPINFEIDQSMLETVFNPQFIKNTTYVWDFGDGSPKTDGLQHTHSYTKIGSYILILTLNISIDPSDPNRQPTQFIDSYLINILPNKDYQGLPQAVVKLNGKKVQSLQNRKPLELNFNYPLLFDASLSKSSSPIVQYLWNFGDGQTGTNPVMNHIYDKTDQLAYDYNVVVLRVKDKNGFISDAFVGLNNNSKQTSQNSSGLQSLFFAGVFVFILLIVSLIVKFILNRKKRKK